MRNFIEILFKTIIKAGIAFIFIAIAINASAQKVEEKESVQNNDITKVDNTELQKINKEQYILKLERLPDEIEKQTELKVEEKIIETKEIEKIKIQDVKQPFNYRIESDDPNIKLIIALSNDDIMKIENNIMQYLKQKNITDRANKVYILNPNFEVKKVTETEK